MQTVAAAVAQPLEAFPGLQKLPSRLKRTDGPEFKAVVDGQSVHYRRDKATCRDELAIRDRLTQVMTWFGYTGTPAPCADPLVAIDVPPTPAPRFQTALGNIHPNPIVGAARSQIQFTMAARGRAVIEIFDVNGRLVKKVFDGIADEGPNVAFWDGTDDRERSVASGVYFYRFVTGIEQFSRKMVVVHAGG